MFFDALKLKLFLKVTKFPSLYGHAHEDVSHAHIRGGGFIADFI